MLLFPETIQRRIAATADDNGPHTAVFSKFPKFATNTWEKQGRYQLVPFVEYLAPIDIDIDMTKNRLMVTIHSKDVTEILALYRRPEIDFPPQFLDRLMHSFPMMYNTI